MGHAFALLALASTLNVGTPHLHSQEARVGTHVTVPKSVEGNAPIVSLISRDELVGCGVLDSYLTPVAEACSSMRGSRGISD